ncbi:MAG: carbohydrate kinase family protein [Clostridia bacterium]|nr:carbohydrate kinase family protein [Clostridia bacterium]
MTPRILVIGTAGIDLIAEISRIPAYGKPQKERNYEYQPGGKAAVAAHTVANFEGEAILCSVVGHDTHGSKLYELFRDRGIDTRYISVDRKSKTPLSIVLAEKNGSIRTISYPGASKKLSSSDVEKAFNCYPNAVYMTLDIPEQVAVEATQAAKKLGIPVFVDAVGAGPDFPFEELENVEIFMASDEEILMHTDIDPKGYHASLRACTALSKMVSSQFYIIKFEDGGVFAYDGVKFDLLAPCEVSVVDESGAWDVFGGALMTEYLQTKDIRRSCEFAKVAAAVSRTKKGGFPSAPTLDDIAGFIRDNKIDL